MKIYVDLKMEFEDEDLGMTEAQAVMRLRASLADLPCLPLSALAQVYRAAKASMDVDMAKKQQEAEGREREQQAQAGEEGEPPQRQPREPRRTHGHGKGFC